MVAFKKSIAPKHRVERFGDGIELHLGDCLEILPTIKKGSVDLVCTDPPYGNKNNDEDIQYKLRNPKYWGKKFKRREFESPEILNDDLENMRRVVDGSLSAVLPLLVPGSNALAVFCAAGGKGREISFTWLADRMNRDGLEFNQAVIWDKGNGVGLRKWRHRWEFVMVAQIEGAKLAWIDFNKTAYDLIKVSRPYRKIHPNEKPVKLIAWFVMLHVPVGGIVLDPFMGFGTAAIACIGLKRKFIGIEMETKWFDLACRRVEKALKGK